MAHTLQEQCCMRLFPLLLLLGLATPAQAGELDYLAQVTTGYVTSRGELGTSTGPIPIHTRLGLGLRYRRFSLEVDGAWTNHSPSPSKQDLHTDHVTNLSLGPQLRWFVGSSVSLRAGIGKHWLSGSGEVRRSCGQTGACDAGFYPESPSYEGIGTRVGVGFYRGGPIGTNTSLAVIGDIGVERMSLDYFGDSKVQHSLFISIGVAVGSGNRLQGRH